MGELAPETRRRLEAAAYAHGFSVVTALCLHRALVAGNGMAQFSHPELGGLGQWAGGGMIMIGEMGNPELRRRVGALCVELAALQPALDPGCAISDPTEGGFGADRIAEPGAPTPAPRQWWPAGLGIPSSSGVQGEVAYAWFPHACRLAVRQSDRLAVYNTSGHSITGLSQCGGTAASIRLHGESGEIGLSDFIPADEYAPAWTAPRVVDAATTNATAAHADPAAPAGADAAHPVREEFDRAGAAVSSALSCPDDPLAMIDRLAELRASGILTDQEFVAKKTELLGRL